MKPSFKPPAKAAAVPFRRDMEAQVFVGVRAICSYMRIGPSTFYTWARGYDFPATRTPDGRWMTCTALIDSWIGHRLEQQQRGVLDQDPTDSDESEAVHE
jgi:hypothetical protein